MVMNGNLNWNIEHTIQCTNDEFWKCALETCIIMLTSFTPISSIKRKKSEAV